MLLECVYQSWKCHFVTLKNVGKGLKSLLSMLRGLLASGMEGFKTTLRSIIIKENSNGFKNTNIQWCTSSVGDNRPVLVRLSIILDGLVLHSEIHLHSILLNDKLPT